MLGYYLQFRSSSWWYSPHYQWFQLAVNLYPTCSPVCFYICYYLSFLFLFFFVYLLHQNHSLCNVCFLHCSCGSYGQVGIIFFNNTPCQFPLQFITIINYYTRNAVLVDGFLWYYSTCSRRARTAMLKWEVCPGPNNVVVLVYKQQLLCLKHLLHMAAVMRRDTNGYSFGMTDSSLLFRWTIYSLEVYACVLGMPCLLWDVTAWLAAPLWLAVERSTSQWWGEWLPVYYQSFHATVM